MRTLFSLDKLSQVCLRLLLSLVTVSKDFLISSMFFSKTSIRCNLSSQSAVNSIFIFLSLSTSFDFSEFWSDRAVILAFSCLLSSFKVSTRLLASSNSCDSFSIIFSSF